MSLFPLGLISQGGGAGGAAFELISTVSGTGSSGTVTFSGIPSTYKHLQIRATIRDTSAAQQAGLYARVNGITTSSYAFHQLYGDGASASSFGSANATSVNIGYTVAANGNTNAHSATVLDILDYALTTKNKTMRALNGKADLSNNIGVYGGAWFSTSAIDSVSIICFAGNFTTTSRFSLYGVRGS